MLITCVSSLSALRSVLAPRSAVICSAAGHRQPFYHPDLPPWSVSLLISCLISAAPVPRCMKNPRARPYPNIRACQHLRRKRFLARKGSVSSVWPLFLNHV
ncbi:unnamed protein product [Ectocarpus fasciculatus]